jgi:hypothetical protein
MRVHAIALEITAFCSHAAWEHRYRRKDACKWFTNPDGLT